MSLPDRNLSVPVTYLITPGALSPENFETESDNLLRTIDRASKAGVSAVQIREKRLPSRLLFELTFKVRSLLQDRETLCLVNERYDIAEAAGAHGVHLTTTSIPVSVVRGLVPGNFVIGVSTHTIEEVSEAANASADLAVFGPVYETPGKPSPESGDRLADVGRASEVSGEMLLLGVGGINEENFRDVLKAGADGIAAIRLFGDQVSTETVIRSLSEGSIDAKAKGEE
ncbi:MAG TPA: thiamine phosphate synthase [Aridibacter sp.]|nr:thiamine phosphate synthase [Aridibacter sp.]